jgi:hypothetical protein
MAAAGGEMDRNKISAARVDIQILLREPSMNFLIRVIE